jgi:membrane protease YdiL (CAAX protease family)
MLRIFIGVDWIIALDEITWSNVGTKILVDVISMLIIPLILLIVYRKHWKDFNLHIESRVLIVILLIALSLLFQLHNDFTIKGFYQLLYYLFVVAFAEEFLYRGFIYNRLKVHSKVLAIIISGALWGLPHSILASILTNASAGDIMINMLSQIVGGVFAGWFFIYLQEKSKTLLVPILIHAILNYTIGYLGAVITVAVFLYYRIKYRPKDERIR